MSNNFFKSSLDQVFAELLKQSGGPPPLPEEIGVVSPWDEDVGEDKPIGLMTKEDLANFIRGLDEQTFNELKSILDKIEMPEADDLDEEVEEVLGPEKTVDEAMKELPQNERSEFLNKLRLSKAHKLSNRKIAMTEEEYLQSVPENMKETFKAMSDKEKAFLLNLPLNVEDPNGLAFVELKHLIQEREADTNTPEEFWREVVRISTEMVKDLDKQFTGPRF